MSSSQDAEVCRIVQGGHSGEFDDGECNSDERPCTPTAARTRRPCCGLSREIASDSQVKSPNSHVRCQNTEKPIEMWGFCFWGLGESVAPPRRYASTEPLARAHDTGFWWRKSAGPAHGNRGMRQVALTDGDSSRASFHRMTMPGRVSHDAECARVASAPHRDAFHGAHPLWPANGARGRIDLVRGTWDGVCFDRGRSDVDEDDSPSVRKS
jgi:hypothetical protein